MLDSDVSDEIYRVDAQDRLTEKIDAKIVFFLNEVIVVSALG